MTLLLFVVIVSGCGKNLGEDVETIPSLTIPVTVDSSAPATSSKRPSAQVSVEDEAPSDEAVATSTTRAAAVTVAVPSRLPIDAEVLVVGDSLIVESQDVIRERLLGSTIVARTGAAPCSMIEEATAAASSADVVVLAFSGNGSFLAPCMAGRDDDLGAAYRESYEDYASAIGVDRLRMTMTPVWGGPQAAHAVMAREVALDWAMGRGVPVIDAAADLGGWSFLFEDVRRSGEPGLGTPDRVQLRSSDSIHLCVAPNYAVGLAGPPCPAGTSAGIDRYAAGIERSAGSL